MLFSKADFISNTLTAPVRARHRGVSRRAVLAGLGGLVGVAGLPGGARAQDGAVARIAPTDGVVEELPSDVTSDQLFDWLTTQAETRATRAYQPPHRGTGFAKALDFDDYRMIQFDADHARWAGSDALFRLHAYHLGWLFEEPVAIYELADGQVSPMRFGPDDFRYHGDAREKVGAVESFPGVAGFRLNYPLNAADRMDELIAFQGASYFRALGRGSTYGISARGLAVNTAGPNGEEFPVFTAFYVERPAPGARTVTVHATLDSRSVTGAYRFVIQPGNATRIDVTARLFFRADIERLGIAPLTSMYLFAEGNRAQFDDYRKQVHDSNGLSITRAGGDRLWRALNNPSRLATSFFAEPGLEGFGLYQRDRAFADYQDAEAHYQDRPSVEVTPTSDWGPGKVVLVEIPTDLEVNDNIVAFWTPDAAPRAGEARNYAYSLSWGDLPPDADGELAYVLETRTGPGGVSGVAEADRTSRGRKFVVDFEGGMLGSAAPEDEIEPVVSISRGKIEHIALSRIDGTQIWRLVIDAAPEGAAAMELVAHLTGYGRKLSETWLYQWMNKA